jgi:hypothetical protein
MAVKTVRPEIELLHEPEMTRGHVKVPSLSCQLAGFGENRDTHENRVAHLVMKRHGFLHFACLRESEIGCFTNQVYITSVPGALRQLGEDQVAGQV